MDEDGKPTSGHPTEKNHDDGDPAVGSTCRQERTEVSYRRAFAALSSSDEAEIVVPSLVSLSQDFFLGASSSISPVGPQGAPVCFREEGVVDAVRALSESVRRLEEREDDVDESESAVVTRLAEIVLRPETKYPSDVTNEYPTSRAAHLAIASLGSSIPRRVCQHPFRRNDIVWVCRTCQSDETCVLCHECFVDSHHEGHDVAFYHAQAGGCCDCGDADGESVPPSSRFPST